MARRCIDIELGGNLIASSVLTNLDSLPTNIGNTAYNLYNQRAVPSFISSYGYVVGDISLSNYSYASANNDITLVGERNGDDGTVTCTVYNAGNQYFTFTYFSLNVAYYNPTAWAGWVVDDENEIGWVLRIVKLPSFMGDQYIVDVYGGDHITYNALHGAVPVLYNWSSVPAISGKNGILSLSTIKSAYINDGEPVTGATASNFDALTEETNVGTLVNDTSVDESKVVVRYNIPDGTYQYIKLVYKPNSEPETVSDGVVINIPQVDSQVVIDDIITAGTYYFKIFTNAGNSNTVVLNYVGIVPIIINIERVW